jgi:hypothetical protein
MDGIIHTLPFFTDIHLFDNLFRIKFDGYVFQYLHSTLESTFSPHLLSYVNNKALMGLSRLYPIELGKTEVIFGILTP